MSLAVIGCLLSIIFIDGFYEDDECINSDDGTSKDSGFCTKHRLQACQAVALVFCLATIALTYYFLSSGRYAKFQQINMPRESVHPVSEEGPKEEIKEPDMEAAKGENN
jgi:hypothetical protein